MSVYVWPKHRKLILCICTYDLEENKIFLQIFLKLWQPPDAVPIVSIGQSLWTEITPPLISLNDYIVDRRVDITRYVYLQRTLDHYEEFKEEVSSQSSMKCRCNHNE